jgi:hypothetical protein
MSIVRVRHCRRVPTVSGKCKETWITFRNIKNSETQFSGSKAIICGRPMGVFFATFSCEHAKTHEKNETKYFTSRFIGLWRWYICTHTECSRRNVPHFGRVFLMVCIQYTRIYHKSGQYSSSRLLFKTRRFGDWIVFVFRWNLFSWARSWDRLTLSIKPNWVIPPEKCFWTLY